MVAATRRLTEISKWPTTRLSFGSVRSDLRRPRSVPPARRSAGSSRRANYAVHVADACVLFGGAGADLSFHVRCQTTTPSELWRCPAWCCRRPARGASRIPPAHAGANQGLDLQAVFAGAAGLARVHLPVLRRQNPRPCSPARTLPLGGIESDLEGDATDHANDVADALGRAGTSFMVSTTCCTTLSAARWVTRVAVGKC